VEYALLSPTSYLSGLTIKLTSNKDPDSIFHKVEHRFSSKAAFVLTQPMSRKNQLTTDSWRLKRTRLFSYVVVQNLNTTRLNGSTIDHEITSRAHTCIV